MRRTASGDLNGEVVVVTGGARGIGRAIAERALAGGARVALVDVDSATLQATLEDLQSDQALACVADVTNQTSVERGTAQIVSRFGSPTVLVNNAGRNAYGVATTMSVDEWNSVFAVDLMGAWLTARAVLPGMIEARRGSIVNVASLHARLTTTGMFPYAAAKAGLVGLTRSLALDVAPYGIRVNAVSPGYISTELGEQYFEQHPNKDERNRALSVQPLGRFGNPEEVAEVACFLASKAASFVSGADWAVDGALGARFA